MQTVIMIIGAFVLMAIGFNETGGYDRMIESYFNATAANRNYVQWIFPFGNGLNLGKNIGSGHGSGHNVKQEGNGPIDLRR